MLATTGLYSGLRVDDVDGAIPKFDMDPHQKDPKSHLGVPVPSDLRNHAQPFLILAAIAKSIISKFWTSWHTAKSSTIQVLRLPTAGCVSRRSGRTSTLPSERALRTLRGAEQKKVNLTVFG